MMQTNQMEYQDGNTLLELFYAFDNKQTGKRPAVLIAHDWSGRTDFTHNKAIKLAEMGYVGIAIDMYGKGKIGQTKEEKTALMQPLADDRAKLQQRILAAFHTVQKIDQVDPRKIGAIGFCFGGLCALDLARSGADVSGVVSFHGLLTAPTDVKKHRIKAKILALHGHDDPMGKPEQVLVFETEMTEAKVDWQLNVYGNTMHAFTNPMANDPDFGTVYNASADKRSWIAMTNFFEEVFA